MSQLAATIASSSPSKSELETSTIRAISWRLIPFLVLAYFFSYLDRVNLGFAALTMNAELKFSPIVFSRRICRWGRRRDEPLASRHSGACVARTPDAQLRIGESRDSPMWNCTSEVWSFGPSRNDGVGW